MRLKTIPSLVLPLLFLAGFTYAAPKPNFTGEWKMNADKSSFAPLPIPEKLTRKISHRDPSLKIITSQSGQQRDIVTELSYTTDGRECQNTIRGQVATGHANWDGDKLVIESKRTAQGMEISQTETWALSEDRQTVTIVNHVITPQAAFDITIVLEKQ
ncbi:MAG: hypothetical protein U0Q18_33640 [Bryobacteraceae bacterium]